MRLLLPALFLLLAACQLSLPGQGTGAGPGVEAGTGAAIVGDEITVTSLEDIPAAPDPAGEAAASGAPDAPAAEAVAPPGQSGANAPAEGEAADGTEAPAEEPAPVVVPKSPAQIACERKGGTFGPAGKSGARTCIRPTRDAGKQCTRGNQCEGYCLARSRTCAPLTPLFGCHDILQDDGRRVTLCID